jgi:hypothetical protein
MRGIRRAIRTSGFFTVALLPVVAAVSWAAATPVAIAQPLAATVGAAPLIEIAAAREPVLPESVMLVLVGSGLLGIASIVSTTTRM